MGSVRMAVACSQAGSVQPAGSDDMTMAQAPSLLAKVAGILRVNPAVPVAVKSDEAVPYGEVIQLMVLLQRAGAATVGLVTEPTGEPQG